MPAILCQVLRIIVVIKNFSTKISFWSIPLPFRPKVPSIYEVKTHFPLTLMIFHIITFHIVLLSVQLLQLLSLTLDIFVDEATAIKGFPSKKFLCLFICLFFTLFALYELNQIDVS